MSPRSLICFLLPYCVAFLDQPCNISSAIQVLSYYNNYLNVATNMDVLKILEKGENLATFFDNFGIPYSGSVASLIKNGTSELKNDTYEALMENYKATRERFKELEKQVSEAHTEVKFYSFEAIYEIEVRMPLDYFEVNVNVCLNPSSFPYYCSTTFYQICQTHNPLKVLKALHKGLGSSCNPPTKKSIETYFDFVNKIDKFERERIDFMITNYDDIVEYKSSKTNFLSNILTDNMNVQNANNEFEDLILNDKTSIKDATSFFQHYANTTCYLARIYDHYNQSIHAFLIYTKYFFNDLIKTMEFFISCGKFESVKDPIYKSGRNLFVKILDKMNNYVYGTLAKSWPSVIAAKAAMSIRKNKNLNTTASEILQEIVRVGQRNYKYLVFVSPYVVDSENYHVYARCDKNFDCYENVEGHIRYHIFRYQIFESYGNRLQHLHSIFEIYKREIYQIVFDNDKVSSLRDLHALIQNATDTNMEYGNFIYFHESAFVESEAHVKMGFAVEKYEDLPMYGFQYVFQHHPWHPFYYQNDEEFFIFLF